MRNGKQSLEAAAQKTLDEVKERMARRGRRASRGTLVAEGDSWFRLLGSDVLDELEDLGYDVESVAHPGDTVESMAYLEGQIKKLARVLNRLANRKRPPRAILLSGGGNDITGDVLAFLLNHRYAGLETLNEEMLKGLIDVRLFAAYDQLVSLIDELNARLFRRPVRIVVHGYDYAVPDGRGFLGGWWVLPGPWLKPAFNRRGYEVLSENRKTVRKLIDRFNRMLAQLEKKRKSVRYVDLRGTLRDVSPRHRQDWRDELHPRERGFELIAQKIADAVDAT